MNVGEEGQSPIPHLSTSNSSSLRARALLGTQIPIYSHSVRKAQTGGNETGKGLLVTLQGTIGIP